jgi:hypothetical protein
MAARVFEFRVKDRPLAGARRPPRLACDGLPARPIWTYAQAVGPAGGGGAMHTGAAKEIQVYADI